MKKITLMQEQIEESKWLYRVLQLSNAVSPKVGSTLTEVEAKKYCEDKNWNVTIKSV